MNGMASILSALMMLGSIVYIAFNSNWIWVLVLSLMLVSGGLILLLGGLALLKDAYQRKASNFVDLIADSQRFTLKFSHGKIISATREELRDIQIKRINALYRGNTNWRIMLFSQKNRVAVYVVKMPTKSDPRPIEEAIGHAMVFSEKAKMKIIMSGWNIKPVQ
jgi:hypothetical protein